MVALLDAFTMDASATYRETTSAGMYFNSFEVKSSGGGGGG
jgi:hypothetical protein